MIEPQQAAPDESVKRFLRLCLRHRWDPTALGAARTLTTHGDFDWDGLRQVAQAEGLAPLLYRIVRGQNLLPLSVKQDLRRAYDENVLRNTFLFHKLEEVLRHLATEGVDIILLKGAALSKTVYGSAGVRPMGDLDLLVREEDVPTALRVLPALGYETVPPLAYRSEVMLRKQGLVETVIEVHWNLFVPPYYQHVLPIDWFWQTALPVRIGNAPSLVLGPEAQVLHLCGHLLLHHSGEELLWLHDVAEVIAFYREQIDWEQVLARAQAYDLVLPTQQILTRVGEEWQAPIPPDVLERLRALRPSRDEERVFAWLAARHSSAAQRFWADLASMPGWGPRLRFVWRNLFPPAGYVQHCYRIAHPLLLPLYYPYRWFLGLRSAL